MYSFVELLNNKSDVLDSLNCQIFSVIYTCCTARLHRTSFNRLQLASALKLTDSMKNVYCMVGQDIIILSLMIN